MATHPKLAAGRQLRPPSLDLRWAVGTVVVLVLGLPILPRAAAQDVVVDRVDYIYLDYADLLEHRRRVRAARIAGVVEGAKEILRQAERQGKNASKELQARNGKMWKANLDRQEAELDESAAVHEQCRIEAAFRKDEAREPSIQKALADLAAARADMDRELHRLVPRLPRHQSQPTAADFTREMGQLDGQESQRLEQDGRYQEARSRAVQAAADLERSRRAVYEKQPAWAQANAAEAEARQRRLAAEKRIVLANAGRLSDALTAHSAERAANHARVVIERGRAMIRELGGVPPPSPPKRKPKHKPSPSSSKDHSKKSAKHRPKQFD